eukprot:7388059-Prymnesium_polylepis.1
MKRFEDFGALARRRIECRSTDNRVWKCTPYTRWGQVGVVNPLHLCWKVGILVRDRHRNLASINHALVAALNPAVGDNCNEQLVSGHKVAPMLGARPVAADGGALDVHVEEITVLGTVISICTRVGPILELGVDNAIRPPIQQADARHRLLERRKRDVVTESIRHAPRVALLRHQERRADSLEKRPPVQKGRDRTRVNATLEVAVGVLMESIAGIERPVVHRAHRIGVVRWDAVGPSRHVD